VDTVTLIGLDFGTTTSSAVIASARLLTNSVTHRTDLADVREQYRSDIVFTPYSGDRLDEVKVASYLDDWLAGGTVQTDAIFGGGALLTGLAAQSANAMRLVEIIRQRVAGALIARADDPCLESWLAFMGSCADLSREHPHTWFLNLDIGGGTTNLALGINGEVLSTGCLFVGARHVEVVPGTYRILKRSTHLKRFLFLQGIRKGPGQELLPSEVETVLDFYLRLLDGAVTGKAEVFEECIARAHEYIPFSYPSRSIKRDEIIVTLSGGVGELVYSALEGKALPSTTYYGDLGIDLAKRFLQSPWVERLGKHIPTGGGRATAFGLMRHSTQVSGSTLFLSKPRMLPLLDLPIFGTIAGSSPDSHLRTLFDLVQRSARGGCVWIRLAEPSSSGVRSLGERMGRTLRDSAFPERHPLVVIVPDNVGKALGQYITQWGTLPVTLLVIDEIAVRDAQYVRVGAPYDHVIPVSFYGLQPPGTST
jgi:ethanolamine utilization protein EutA